MHFLGEKEINTADIKAEIKELRNIDVIFIDYLQLLKPTFPGKSLYESTSNISRELKVLAMEFNIPFVVINSINRDYSNRNDYKPHISDLRNSGQLEYDADLVLMLHRPSMFREADTSKGEDKKTFENKAELIIAKNRFGESNLEIDFYFDGAKSSFKEQSS